MLWRLELINRNAINWRKLFIGGLNIDVTEDNVRRYFEKFGSVEKVKIVRDNLTGHSRGFGFVIMAKASLQRRVLAEKDHVIGGRSFKVRPYTDNPNMHGWGSVKPVLRSKIFVGKVNPALRQDVLENYFSKFGPLEDAKISRNPDGISTGFGFVVFREDAACQQVLAQSNHQITPRDRVEVKPCLSRNRAAGQISAAQSGYRPQQGYGMGHGAMYGGYGYGAANYGGYGQNYGPYGGYGAHLSQQGAKYQGGEAAPYQAAAADYDSYANYYGWNGYSQGVPSTAPYGNAAAAGAPRSAAPVAAGANTGHEQYAYEGTTPATGWNGYSQGVFSTAPYGNAAAAGGPRNAAPVAAGANTGYEQYAYEGTAPATAAWAMPTSSSPYPASKLPAVRPTAVQSAPTQMAVGAPSYNPVRRGVGGAAVPVGYGAVRRPGPY